MREFPNPKALQDYVKIHDLVYQWEGTPSFNERFLQLSPDQCEVVTVTTTRGPTRALLFRKALLRAEWEAEAPARERVGMKRERATAARAANEAPKLSGPLNPGMASCSGRVEAAVHQMLNATSITIPMPITSAASATGS